MTLLKKYLFLLFLLSLFLGHAWAEANGPAKKAQRACAEAIQNRLCKGVKGKIPIGVGKPMQVKGCYGNAKSKKGKQFFVFMVNVSKQDAEKSTPADSKKNPQLCKTAQGAHKRCHLITKDGKTKMQDDIFIIDNNGQQKCKQMHAQTDAKGKPVAKAGKHVTRYDDRGQEGVKQNDRNKKTKIKVRDTRQAAVRTRTVR